MYNLRMLKTIGTLARNNNFFTQFHLPQYIRTKIISLGIRRALIGDQGQELNYFNQYIGE